MVYIKKSEILKIFSELFNKGEGLVIGSEEYNNICDQIIKEQAIPAKNIYYISIDLVQSELTQYYPKANEYSYTELRNYLHSKGFDSRKDTNYISRNEMSSRQFSRLIRDMNAKFPWLVVCANKIDATILEDNNRTFSALTILTNIATNERTIDEIREALYQEVCKEK